MNESFRGLLHAKLGPIDAAKSAGEDPDTSFMPSRCFSCGFETSIFFIFVFLPYGGYKTDAPIVFNVLIRIVSLKGP